MLRLFTPLLASILTTTTSILAATTTPGVPLPEAVLVVVGDQHSAYERYPQLIAHIDRLLSENPRTPLAILINGDSLEYGNVIARRSAGAIDFALYAALARRAPTILNFGNHEPEFYDVAETIHRIEATGVKVLTGNLRHPATRQAYAPASLHLALGSHQAIIVGVTTDRLATFRLAIRPQLDLADPVTWARENFPQIFTRPPAPPPPNLHSTIGTTPSPPRPSVLPIILSHAGLRADRAILPIVPPHTLFAGAHDHLRFIHRTEQTTYFHSGSWLEVISIARLRYLEGDLRWDVEQLPVQAADPTDPEIEKLIHATLTLHLTSEETTVVGHTPQTLSPAAAAAFAVEAARRAATADVAFIGATTFGTGLPAGPVTRFAFDACVRFDGPLFTATITGAALIKILARANQGLATPFADRGGENLLAAANGPIQPERSYRLVTTDWIAKNPQNYLGENPPPLSSHPELKLKAAVLRALQP